MTDLEKAGIPVYRFVQRVGDLVWINVGVVHWIQSCGITNCISWNIGTFTAQQYRSTIERCEWNKTHKYHSLIPILHLTWIIAATASEYVTSRDLREAMGEVMKICIQRKKILHEYLEAIGRTNLYQPKQKEEDYGFCEGCGVIVL